MSTESLKHIRTTIMEKKEIKFSTQTNWIGTGCTLLDLVVGGGQGMGFPAGAIVNIVGDKSSGKTFVACEIVAYNYYHYKDKFKFNYDDAEYGFTFDTQHLYNIELIKKDTLRSHLIEDFDHNTKKFLKKIDKDQIGLYVLDTLDGLSNKDIEERDQKRYNAMEQGKEFKEGTYGMRTPKFLSQEFFRTKTSQFSEKQTLLIFISQVRENIDPFSFKKFNRSGGKALDFYAHTCLWLANVKKIIKKDRAIGIIVEAKADKSKTPRPYRSCRFSIYFDYGIDNIGSNLDYLFSLRGKDGDLLDAAKSICWDRDKKKINLDNIKAFLEKEGVFIQCRKDKKDSTGDNSMSLKWGLGWIENNKKEYPATKKRFGEEFGNTESRDELIARILKDPKLEKELEQRVIDKWEAIENEIKIDRKGKYS